MKNILPLLICSFLFLTSKAQNSNSLSFDGVDDQVIVDGASGFIAGSNSFSITCWVYPTNASPAFPDYDGFCGFRDDLYADFYLVQITPNTVEARFRNDQGVNFDIIDTTMQLNVWQHYAFVYSEPELTLYRNGIPIQTIPASGVISSPADSFYIGNLIYSGNNYWMRGKLDEVSLWNRALGGSEIQCMLSNSIHPASDSLKLYYNFNQGVAGGNNVNDTLLIDRALNMDGRIVGMTLSGFNSNFVPGVNPYPVTNRQLCPGDSIDFNGQYISSPGSYSASYPVGQICDSIALLNVTVTDTSVTQNGQTLIADQPGALYQWLDCNDNYAPVNGATQRSFIPSGDGSYCVRITQGSCSDTSGCYFVLINGINSLIPKQIVAYPNPSNDQLTIQLIAPFSHAEIFISDPAGKEIYRSEVLTNQPVTLQIASWPAGIYFIAFKSENSVQKVRIVHY